jgi:predicted transcriptional regulator of viral defense system
MKFERLLTVASDVPVFESGLLMTYGTSPVDVRKQLARWTKDGKIIQIRRGLYALAEPYRKITPVPFLVANRLRQPSYVSLQSALAHYGMIPEYVPAVTSVTTGRPGHVRTPYGRYIYRHIKKSFFHGFREIEIGEKQSAFVATPEKGLLDLVHLTPHGDSEAYLDELRLQNLEILDIDSLVETAERSGSPKLARAAKYIAGIAGSERYEEL